MLFSHMPIWLFSVLLIAAFFLKQFASERFQRTNYYTTQIDGLGWSAVLNIKALLNGLMTAAILFPFAGLRWCLILALIDAAMQWLSGYYAKRQKLPTLDKAELLSAVNAIRALHAGSYLTFIDIVLKYVMPTLTVTHTS